MSKDFIRFQELLDRLRSTYIRALSAFLIFDELEKLKAPNIVGKEESSNNVDVMNKYNAFFQATIYGLRDISIIELAKIIENHKKSLSLEKLINIAESCKEKMKIEDFSEFNTERNFLEELCEKYEGISAKDILELKESWNSIENIREKIRKFRDQYIAHDDLKKEEVDISTEELNKVFDVVAKILDKLYYKTNFSTNNYFMIKESSINQTKDLINNLKEIKIIKKKRFRTNLLKK